MDRELELELWQAVEVRWAVVKDRLENLVEECRLRLSDGAQTASLEDVRRLQGRIDTLTEVATLPERMIRDLEGQVDKKRHARP